MAAKLTRYLGVQPFKTSDKHIFFGRDEDIDNLLDLIMLEKLIVLFGKSGYGKSSLLSAGIVSKLTDPEQPDTFRYRPIEVRLGTYIENQSLTPFETTKRFIADLPMSKGADFLNNWQTEDSLWRLLKQRQDVENGQFVLIFDQFEELFSYPQEQQMVFKKQLAELLYTHIPQHIRTRLDELSPTERAFMVKPLTIKAVFAIRSDRMSLLDSLKDALPAILHKRYELRPLSTQQAKDAITKPASIESTDFLTPPFEYTEGGLNAIVKALTTTEAKDTTATGIEAFQLQIVCEYIETLVRDGKVPDIDGNGLPDITEAQLPEMASLYENYYRRKLAELDDLTQPSPSRSGGAVQMAAQRVLEDGLLAEDAATGEGRRMSVDSRALLGQFSPIGLTEKLLVDLEKTYLIRREVNTVGGFSFEISHDTLVAPIQKAKAERKAIEDRERAEREQLEREQQLVEAKKQADIERKRRQRATALAIAAGVLFLISAISGFFAFNQQKKANEATLEALAQKDNADKNFKLAEQRSKEAKLNADLATMARIEAEKNFRLASEQKGIATDALKKAEDNFRIAKENEDKAKKALDEAQAANVRVVAAYLRDIEQHILKLEYDAAFEKCQTALALNVDNQKADIAKFVLEIAYFYTETDTFQAALNTLKLLNINALSNRTDLLAAIQKNAPPQYFQVLEEKYYPKMIVVEGGSFTMKDDSAEYEVRLNPYKMAETETTVWQYFLYLKSTRQKPYSTPTWQYWGDNPMIYVSWYDAVEYANWVSERRKLSLFYDIDKTNLDTLTNLNSYDDIKWTIKTNQQAKGYRLPTGAEWEYAARGGTHQSNFKYSGSNDINEVAWYNENSSSRTQPVKRLKPNALGLYDMSGNVWEWCFDWYSEKFNISSNKYWISPEKGSSRVVRGGSWNNNNDNCRVSNRHNNNPNNRNNNIGFRCVRYGQKYFFLSEFQGLRTLEAYKLIV